MGQVFEAHDQVLNRRVALKAAHATMPAGLLRKEAQALAAVRHPSMVTVHQVGRHRGIEFIVMERIYGVSLASHIEKRTASGEAFGVPETLDVLSAIADGLVAVHRSGIAHRDIKPENVMLTPGGRLVLMDFGLMLAEFEVAEQAYIAGSPHYMAPEVIHNVVAPGSGNLADLYALGVLAFEMLTGNPPYDAGDIDALFDLHLKAPVPDVRAHRPDVPEALALLMTRLMAKSPLDRPSGADAVLYQLRQISATPVVAPAAPTGAPFRVLVVDDDPDITRVLGFYVRKVIPEAEVRTAADGIRALEAVRESPPDVMLLDLNMPRMNGIEVAMYLRGTHFADRSTIVSVSASVQQHDVQLLRELGIEHFVPKGPNLGERLATTLREIRRRR